MCYFLGSLFADYASDCYVRCGCIGFPGYQFSGVYIGLVIGSFPLSVCVNLLIFGCTRQSVMAFLDVECMKLAYWKNKMRVLLQKLF